VKEASAAQQSLWVPTISQGQLPRTNDHCPAISITSAMCINAREVDRQPHRCPGAISITVTAPIGPATTVLRCGRLQEPFQLFCDVGGNWVLGRRGGREEMWCLAGRTGPNRATRRCMRQGCPSTAHISEPPPFGHFHPQTHCTHICCCFGCQSWPKRSHTTAALDWLTCIHVCRYKSVPPTFFPPPLPFHLISITDSH
jgi:hypothetical protein